ncbi:MAG: DNA gyrase subunit B [Candidatus Calescibacterium sp.]|nr:DNA gyrase subunit B [Candidatus Calescibacterium sp.]MDW8195355.1 DNA gyrase subunit B [Candidatus Calescibacterium sp.]
MKVKSKSTESYTGKDIKVLKGLEAVRQRPAMYIGSTDKKGLHHLINEVVDNSIDEAVAGYCNHIRVTITKNGECIVEDNGRGIPVDIVPSEGKSALEVVLTVLHAGAKFSDKVYKISGGLHGVGVSVVNALSEYLIAEVHRDGYIWVQIYERGVPITPVQKKGKTSKTGTIITFKPDFQIFRNINFDPDIILERLEELAYLNPFVTIEFIDENSGINKILNYPNGIRDFVENIIYRNSFNRSYEVQYVKNIYGDIVVEIAFVHTDSDIEISKSFANNINTVDGGTHLTTFRNSFTRLVNTFAIEKIKEKDVSLSGDDIRQSMVYVVSVKVPNPQFEGQTKSKLVSHEVKSAIENTVMNDIKRIFDSEPEIIDIILQKALVSYKARIAAKRAKQIVIARSRSDILYTVAGKLADCISRDVSKREIYIVEGDSAGGSAKNARDRNTQAVLPLKGKIINVEKSNIEKILQNNEIRAIIAALGCGIDYEDKKMDISKLRYSKVIIATDADVDGYHIRTLLLTFFYRFMRLLIYHGNLYLAYSPLYRIITNNKSIYVYSQKELEKEIKNLKKYRIQRFKGLGEMNPDQLWETIMNPKTRILKKVSLDDAEKAEKIINILMGIDVEERKKIILQSSSSVSINELDV